MFRLLLIFFCCITWLFAAHSHADSTYHRWVDDEGVTHYSKTPPKDRNSEQVSTRTQKGNVAPAQESQPSDGSTDEQEDDEASQTIKKWCEQHRENLKTLKESNNVQTTDEEGEKRILNEKERAQMIRDIEKQLEGCE